MEFAVKNIVLYDEFGNVVGFAEFKIRQDRTDVKVRNNLSFDTREIGQAADGGELIFSFIADGQAERIFAVNGAQSLFEIRGRIDAEREIFICLSRRRKNEHETLASGVINQGKVTSRKVAEECVVQQQVPEVDTADLVNHEALRELDDAMRSICVIDENGKGQCETCPYREHFFGAAADEKDIVV